MTKELETIILQHCEGSYTSLKSIAEQFPKSTVYRCAAKLIQRGFLKKSGREYRTTREGENQLTASNSETSHQRASPPPASETPQPEKRQKIRLHAERSNQMSNGRNVAPNVKLGAAIMQKLSYLAEDMGVDIEEALRIVVGRWKVTKISKAKFRHLNDIASVLEQCDEAELDVQEVKSFLFWRDTLRKLGLSVDDVPKAIEYAETGKEANLTFQNIRGFWTTYEKLKAIGVAFTDLEQLKHDIENLHELAGEPEERIKELFSFLSQKDSLKEELARLQSETAQEREQLEHVKYELGEHKKYTTELAADNARTARQLSESKLHLANIDGNRQKLQKEIQKHEVTSNVLYSFEDFLLSRKAYIKDEFWYWLELIFKKKLKHDPLTEPHPPELQEQLRRQIVKYLKEMVEPDLLSKFDLDKIRTDARIAAAERLQRKHATVVKRMHQIRKDAKELEGGLQDFVDGIDHPRLDDDE